MNNPSRKKNSPSAGTNGGPSTNATVATVATAVTVSMLGAISYAASSALSHYFPDERTSTGSDFPTVPPAIARSIIRPPIDIESEENSNHDLCDLLNFTTATIADLKSFSITCQRMIRKFVDKGDMMKVSQLAKMNQIVMETRNLRLESSQATLNGMDTSVYPSRLAEMEQQIQQCQKELTALFPEFVPEDQSILVSKTERKSSFFRRVRESIMGADDKKSGSNGPCRQPTATGKRVLRSDSSSTSTAVKKAKRSLENAEHGQGGASDARTVKRSSTGKRLCGVDGCSKVSDGLRSNHMCRKHYNESKQKPLEQDDRADPFVQEDEEDSPPPESQAMGHFLNQDDGPSVKKCEMTGRRLCCIDDCRKFAKGRRYDYMCSRHYSEFHCHECTVDGALDSPRESQDMSALTVEDSQDNETTVEHDDLFGLSDGGNSEEVAIEDGHSVEE